MITPTVYNSMNELICSGVSIEELKENAARGECCPEQKEDAGHMECCSGAEIALADVELLSPIPRPLQDVICLGINYAAHAEESARFKKESFDRPQEYTIYFSKRVNEAVAPGGYVLAHDDIEKKLDYEVELAVVIGKEAKNVSAEEARDYIFGYTILNDMSARDLQMNHKQWYMGKSLDAFTPIGPWIVTEDEIEWPPALAIKSWVNGEPRQDSNTDMLLRDIGGIIEELSGGITLMPGTIIATGTPSGVGMGFQPPKFLNKGDVIRCEIEGIGILENRVK
jgi:2-keto-4-pentenoate hydratase/2-oxohepta-3-ene-1,7-dioic acid hydratase in catechol pathway